MYTSVELLWKRQSSDDTLPGSSDFDNSNDDDNSSWWWSPTGLTVRYILVALIFTALLLYFVGGYRHAQRRMRNGHAPLPYHRWMAPRRGYGAGPRYNQYQPYAAQYAPQRSGQGPAYGMDGYAPPPPAYNNDLAPPPAYQPPEGGSKVMADQNVTAVYPQQCNVGESNAGVAAPPPVRH